MSSRLFGLCAVLVIATTAHAQTPITGFGAMQPSAGRVTAHEMFTLRFFDGDETTQERDARELRLNTQLAFGLTGALSLSLDLPVLYRKLDGNSSAPDDSAFGFGDIDLLAKWRIWQQDTTPTDTVRVALLGGLQLPGGTKSLADSMGDAWNPLVGAVFSTVRGRHGLNVSALWEFDTGGDDRPDGGLRYDASYLFRLAPEQYGESTSNAAWYAVLELNGLYETNSDHTLIFAPGIMYEATSFTLDAFIGVPIVDDVEQRPETEWVFGIGVRLSF